MNPTNWSRPFSRLTGNQQPYQKIPDVDVNTFKNYTITDFPEFTHDMNKNLSSRTAGVKNFCRNSLNLLSDYNNYCLNKVEQNIAEFKSLFDGLRGKPFMTQPLSGHWKINDLITHFSSADDDGVVPKKIDIKSDESLFNLAFSKATKKAVDRSGGVNRSVLAALGIGRRTPKSVVEPAPALAPDIAITSAAGLVRDDDVHSTHSHQAGDNADDASSDSEDYSDEASVTSADSIASSVDRTALPRTQKISINLKPSTTSENAEKSSQGSEHVSIQNQESWEEFIKLPDAASRENSTHSESDLFPESSSKPSSHSFDFEEHSSGDGHSLPSLDAGSLMTEKSNKSSTQSFDFEEYSSGDGRSLPSLDAGSLMTEKSSKSSTHSFDFEEHSWGDGRSLPSLDAGSLMTEKKEESPESTPMPLSLKGSTIYSGNSIPTKRSAEIIKTSGNRHPVSIANSSPARSVGSAKDIKSTPESITTDVSQSSTFYTADNGADEIPRQLTPPPHVTIAPSVNTNISQVDAPLIEAANAEKRSINKSLVFISKEIELKESNGAVAGSDLKWLKEELKARIKEVNALVDLDGNASTVDRAVRSLRLSMLRTSADLASEYFRRIQSEHYQSSEHTQNFIGAKREKSLSMKYLMGQYIGMPQVGPVQGNDMHEKITEIDMDAKARSNSVLNIKTVANNDAIARLEIAKEMNQVEEEFNLQDTLLQSMGEVILENKLINSSKRYIAKVKEEYAGLKIELKIGGVDLNEIVGQINELPAISQLVQSGLRTIKNTNTTNDSIEDIIKIKDGLKKIHVDNNKKLEQVINSLGKLKSLSGQGRTSL